VPLVDELPLGAAAVAPRGFSVKLGVPDDGGAVPGVAVTEGGGLMTGGGGEGG